MDLSRRKLLASAGTASTLGLAGCLDPDEGSSWDIWLGGDEPDEDELEDTPRENVEPETPRRTEDYEDTPEPIQGSCRKGNAEVRFRVPKGGRVYFAENPVITGNESLEGTITDSRGEGLQINYLDQIKYIGDEESLYGISEDQECFHYSPGGFRDTNHGEWHERCFKVIHEYDDSYLVETIAEADTEGFNKQFQVPVCVYRTED